MRGDAGWHRSVPGILRRTFEAAVEDNIAFLASALSFDLLLTAIPFVALLLGIAGYLVQHQVSVGQFELRELIEGFLPPHQRAPNDRFAALEQLFLGVVENRAKLTLVGVPLFLWFSTRLFAGLRAALNEVFDTEEERPWAVGKLLDLGMVLLSASLFLGSAALSAWVSWLEAWSAGFWRFAVQLVAFASSAALFFVIFKVVPARRIHWRTALVASLFCALAFEVAKRLFTLYLANFATLDRLASDANVAAFLLFLLWVYYTAFVFLLGGEVAETYDLVRLRRIQRVRLG
ncbi:MAG TPA: YihY/virulence factor BrkB family protein [Gemmatimonadales bacterium]|nr:YihY/virulence factor BrkB family protein [Gemmatimonadales bacterium]